MRSFCKKRKGKRCFVGGGELQSETRFNALMAGLGHHAITKGSIFLRSIEVSSAMREKSVVERAGVAITGAANRARRTSRVAAGTACTESRGAAGAHAKD